MKKLGLLNRDLSTIVAAMGHYDRLVICDAGFSIPIGMEYVDLSLKAGNPTVLEVVDIVLQELEVEEVYIASEALTSMPDRLNVLADRVPEATISDIPHADFKVVAASARAIIRTGDFSPYANVIVVSGVVY